MEEKWGVVRDFEGGERRLSGWKVRAVCCEATSESEVQVVVRN